MVWPLLGVMMVVPIDMNVDVDLIMPTVVTVVTAVTAARRLSVHNSLLDLDVISVFAIALVDVNVAYYGLASIILRVVLLVVLGVTSYRLDSLNGRTAASRTVIAGITATTRSSVFDIELASNLSFQDIASQIYCASYISAYCAWWIDNDLFINLPTTIGPIGVLPIGGPRITASHAEGEVQPSS